VTNRFVSESNGYSSGIPTLDQNATTEQESVRINAFNVVIYMQYFTNTYK